MELKSFKFKSLLLYLKNADFKGIIDSFGVVFGDIGTSPIYTLTVVFILTKPTPTNVIGVLSLVFWTLITLVSLEYTILAMSLSKKGEGGTIVLREILVPLLKSGRRITFVTIITYIGISLIIGDGVITPAISILSAVEGLLLIPGLEHTKQGILIFIASIICIALFSFQRKGTEKVAGAFGPLMLLWFFALSLSGIISIIYIPSVFKAINPYFAIKFLSEHGITGFFVLSEVILCATGGEALFADIGQLGRQPISRAWNFVFVALVLNYFGQGAFAIRHPDAKNILFEMVFNESRVLYVPFLILSIIATIIASQAMISGMFSIVYQGITTRIMPIFKIDYTSTERRSQIYIGTVNWFLLIAVLFVIYEFKESNRLAAAYGLAVTGTMTLTGIIMTWIFYLKKQRIKYLLSLFVTFVDIVFLLSNLYKIPHGGYWSIIIGLVPLSLVLIYTSGQKRLYKSLKPMDLDVFLEKFNYMYRNMSKIKGTALFFIRDITKISPYIVHTIFSNNIIYEDNIVISIIRLDEPFGIDGCFKETITKGMRLFEVKVGYMEVLELEEILKKAGVEGKTIFYGLEEIVTGNIIWKIFSFIKKVTPSYVQFYKLPSDTLHGVVTRVEM